MNQSNVFWVGLGVLMPIIGLLLVLLIIAAIVMIRKSDQMHRKYWMMMEDYYNEIQEQVIKVRQYYHDIGKHIRILDELNQNKKQDAQTTQYISELQDQYEELTKTDFSDNVVVNAVLTKAVKKCQKKHIKLRVDMQSYCNKRMKETEQVAILANLLDNAIEACEKIEDESLRHISIKSAIQGNSEFLEVENSINTKYENEIQQMKTRKKDAWLHGNGMKIIKRYINKYNGEMQYNVNHEKSTVNIILQWSNV